MGFQLYEIILYIAGYVIFTRKSVVFTGHFFVSFERIALPDEIRSNAYTAEKVNKRKPNNKMIYGFIQTPL